MKKLLKSFSNRKYTFLFVILSLAFPTLIALVIFQGILVPRDNVIAFIGSLLLLGVLNKKLELKGGEKFTVIASVVVLSTLMPIIIMLTLISSPAQKSHDTVMYEICLPELRKYYNIKEGDSFPQDQTDKSGNGKWWYQHLECENNVALGKGPIFSSEPAEFHPIN